jgi:hypothetical protein
MYKEEKSVALGLTPQTPRKKWTCGREDCNVIAARDQCWSYRPEDWCRPVEYHDE